MNAPFIPAAVARRTERLPPQLAALARACPFAADNPRDCPLHDLRTMRPRDVRRWFAGLSSDEAQFLVRYHECCLAVKLEAQPFRRPRRPAGKTRRR